MAIARVRRIPHQNPRNRPMEGRKMVGYFRIGRFCISPGSFHLCIPLCLLLLRGSQSLHPEGWQDRDFQAFRECSQASENGRIPRSAGSVRLDVHRDVREVCEVQHGVSRPLRTRCIPLSQASSPRRPAKDAAHPSERGNLRRDVRSGRPVLRSQHALILRSHSFEL